MHPFVRQMTIAAGAVFLEALANDDDEQAARLVAAGHADPVTGCAARARRLLGSLSPAECAALGAAYYDRLDATRTATFADGAFVVLAGPRGPVAMRIDSESSIRVTPGAELGRVTGVRVRLARSRRDVGGRAVAAVSRPR